MLIASVFACLPNHFNFRLSLAGPVAEHANPENVFQKHRLLVAEVRAHNPYIVQGHSKQVTKPYLLGLIRCYPGNCLMALIDSHPTSCLSLLPSTSFVFHGNNSPKFAQQNNSIGHLIVPAFAGCSRPVGPRNTRNG